MSSPRRERVERGIYKRAGAGGEVFEIGWRDAQGRQRWKRVQGGITAARAALAEAHAARSRGERIAANPRMAFNEAADAWWEARAVKLRPATQSAYSAGLKHLRAYFGRTRMDRITPKDVAAFITAQETDLKGWTIKGQITVLSSVFKYATRHMGFVGINPVSVLEQRERPSSNDERDKRVLDGEELSRLLADIDKHEAPYALIFALTAETGCRLGEALGVVWGDVDLDARVVSFTHQLDRHGQRVPLKTKRSRRSVEVRASLMARLREHKLASPGSGRHDLVFVSRKGNPHDHRNVAGRVLARAVKRAGLDDVERDGKVIEHAPTFHSLRHTHGSALIAAGWDIEEVSARLGHSNVATTQRIYVHAYDVARRSEARRDRLEEMYSTLNPDREKTTVRAL